MLGAVDLGRHGGMGMMPMKGVGRWMNESVGGGEGGDSGERGGGFMSGQDWSS